MKICPVCRHSNADESTFCLACGNKLADEGRQVQTIKPAVNQQKDRINVAFPQNNDFVSNDEYVVATLSNGVVLNLVSGEGFKTEDAVLTNKRLYYNHKTGILNIQTQEEKVNIKDITGSKITNYNPLGIFILAIFVAVFGLFGSIAASDFEIFPIFLLASLFLFVVYLFIKKSHLKIEYAGGSIYFSVKKYGKENIIKFQKSIYAVKDHIESNQK